MKKKLCVILIMGMMLAMLTACGGNAGSNTDTSMDDEYSDMGPEYNETENASGNDSTSDDSEAVLEGIYWLHEEDVFRTGFYMDGNGKYIELRNYDVVEGTYEMFDVYKTSEGTEYEVILHLDGNVESYFFMISADGKIYQEPFVYSVVDEATFYAKDEETTPDSGQGNENSNSNSNIDINAIAGTYWINNDTHGEGGKSGFYIDGNGKYTILLTDGTIREFSYTDITVYSVSNGIEYLISGNEMGTMAYVLGNDGNVYYSWDDGWSGGLDTYVPGSRADFYGN